MLVQCEECGGSVSDKAVLCPHCGIALRKNTPILTSKKRMKLPNGFGRITKLNGKNLRKPYRAMVSLGKDDQGRPIGKLLKPECYFETYNEAYTALVKYHESPYNLEKDLTISELFEEWYDKHSKTIGTSRQRSILSAWKYCKPIYDVKVQLLTPAMVRGFFSSVPDFKPTQQVTVKNILSQMLDYAIECEIVEKNCVRNIKNLIVEDIETVNHISFTDEEFTYLRENYEKIEHGDLLIINCFTGMRPNELISIRTVSVNTSDWTIIGGSKTKAGKNRTIPIHDFIKPIISRYLKNAILHCHEYLLTKDGNAITYRTYYNYFKKVITEAHFNPQHKPHDCRKHFVTMAKRYGVDEYAIKRIVGHTIDDITESVYTDRDVAWLHREISKIPTVY